MGNRSYLAVFALGALVLLLSMAAFTVRETDIAIKFRFGEIVRADYQPGLHFLVPFINNVRKFDRRILTEDYPAEQFLTSEGKILRINFFVKWRIADVSRYYISTAGGTEEVANRRLGEIVKDESRASSRAARSSRSWRPIAASSWARWSRLPEATSASSASS